MKFGDIDIDDFKISGLCRTSIRLAKAFYADPENMKRYEEWKAQRDAEAKASAKEVQA